MADSYKILSTTQLGSAAANICAPGVAHNMIIKNISLANQGANTETVVLYINGTTAPFIWKQLILTASGLDGSSAEWDGTLALQNTDFLAAKATDGTAVNCVVTGDDIS
jgi:hypothetical protein